MSEQPDRSGGLAAGGPFLPVQTEPHPGVRPLEAIERDYILLLLELEGNNRARSAEKLGISLATLYRKLKEYGAMAVCTVLAPLLETVSSI